MTDVEAQLLSMCPLYSYSWWGMGLVFTYLSFYLEYKRQIRRNEVFSMENILPPYLLRQTLSPRTSVSRFNTLVRMR